MVDEDGGIDKVLGLCGGQQPVQPLDQFCGPRGYHSRDSYIG